MKTLEQIIDWLIYDTINNKKGFKVKITGYNNNLDSITFQAGAIGTGSWYNFINKYRGRKVTIVNIDFRSNDKILPFIQIYLLDSRAEVKDNETD